MFTNSGDDLFRDFGPRYLTELIDHNIWQYGCMEDDLDVVMVES